MGKQLAFNRSTQIILGLVAIVVAYVFASLAINSGSLWQYFWTSVFLVVGVKFVFRSFKRHGKD